MSMNTIGQSAWPIRVAEESLHRLKDYAQSAITFFKPSKEADQALDSQSWGALAADVVDHDTQFDVRMEIPGVNPDALRVTIKGRYLFVAGERRANSKRREGTLVITERAFGHFQRMIPLPEDVNAAKVRARYKDGVLVLKIPKRRPNSASHTDVPVTG